MSGWEAYITGSTGLMNRGPIEKAGIFGHNGVAWAQHEINPSIDEITAINNLFSDASPAYAEGFTIGGKKFALVRVEEDMLHGKGKTSSGNTPNAITIQKTVQSLVVAIGKEDANGGQVSVAVGAIGDYLKQTGY
jgi:hypothetical protein